MQTVTVAAIVKDEAACLLEWIAWYRVLGAQRVALYSNDSSDGTDALLAALARDGIVEFRPWPSIPGRSAQTAAYADAVARAGTEWVLFVDADELLVLHEDAHLPAFLARFDAGVGAVALNWRIFGSSGHEAAGPEPVAARFTRAGPRGAHNERHIKTVARTACIAEPHVHSCALRQGRYVNADGAEVAIERLAFTPGVTHGRAQLNHYVVKSAAEFAEKRARGNAHLPPEAANRFTTRDGDFFRLHDLNDEEDRAAHRRLPAVHAEMRRLARIVDRHRGAP